MAEFQKASQAFTCLSVKLALCLSSSPSLPLAIFQVQAMSTHKSNHSKNKDALPKIRVTTNAPKHMAGNGTNAAMDANLAASAPALHQSQARIDNIGTLRQLNFLPCSAYSSFLLQRIS
jgi:hypothetical protein